MRGEFCCANIHTLAPHLNPLPRGGEEAGNTVSSSKLRGERVGDVLQRIDFRRRVFVFALRADAERADNFSVRTNRHAERAAHAGLFRGGLGDAAGVGLEIADCHRLVLQRALARDAFADGDDAHHVPQLRRQTDLRDEAQKLRGRVVFVNGSGFGIKLGERVAQNGFKIFVHSFFSG